MATSTQKVQTKSCPVSVKAAGDRCFRFTISTGDIDRDNDVINPAGWNLAHYKRNPVVLWGHDYTIQPIAKTTDIQVVGQKLIVEVEFPPVGLYPLADQICGLVAGGFLNAASVGFRSGDKTWNARGGWDIHSAELLEFSIVSVPSNAQALIQRCVGEGCDITGMKQWLDGRACGCAGDDKADFIEWLKGIPAPPSDRETFIRDLATVPFEPKQIDIPPALIKRVLTEALPIVIAETAAAETRKALRYLAGCID